MKKSLILLASVLTALCLLAACSAPAPQTNETLTDNEQPSDIQTEAPQTITVTDHLGITVTLPTNIERVAVCDIFPLPSVLAVFFDSADKLVCISPSSMSAAENGLLSELYPEILNASTAPVSGSDVNMEELLMLDPQVVFYSAGNAPLGESLRDAGFNAVAVSAEKWEYDAIETLRQWILLLEQIFPEEGGNRAALVEEYSRKALDLVKERTASLTDEERARVFFLFQYSPDSIVTSGSSFFGQWWADAIGAVNAANEMHDDKSVKVTFEQVYAWDPDTILMTNYNPFTPDDLYGNTVGSYDWSGIDAVRNKRVYKMPLGMYRSYTAGADTPVTLLWLAKAVYPALFEDIDIVRQTIGYYREVFGITLTDAQAASIFAPPGDAGHIDL